MGMSDPSQAAAGARTARAPGPIVRVAAAAQENLLTVMAGIYLLGALAPGLGLWIKHQQVGAVGLFGERPVPLSLTNLLLASMLFTAGLGVSLGPARATLQHPKLLAVGVLANALMPLLFLATFAAVAGVWPDDDEAQSLLVGLALLGAMPIAGGASVWTQNADGNVPLTVGLVLASTLASPVSIPLALRAVSHLTTGDYAEDLAELAGEGTITFSLLSVVLPCALGMFVRHAVGEARLARAVPAVKVVNLLVLLTLSYTNASGALAQVVAAPDYDLLVLVAASAAGMCVASFAVGHRLARLVGAADADTTSLTFGVGMNNSSASSVLASTRLADHPTVLLPILAYSMLQKVLAGGVDAWLRRERARGQAAS